MESSRAVANRRRLIAIRANNKDGDRTAAYLILRYINESPSEFRKCITKTNIQKNLKIIF